MLFVVGIGLLVSKVVTTGERVGNVIEGPRIIPPKIISTLTLIPIRKESMWF
jgi:hypothetical protein